MITRRSFNRSALKAGVGASALSALGAPAIAQRRGGDVVVAQQAQPPSLDAQTTTAQASRNISLHIYETLFARDEAGVPIPDLAEGVDVAPDGLTYRFALRRGVKFHDGSDLTSADVKASLERYGKVGGSAFIMKPVAAIETPDAGTVVVRMSTVSPGFIEGLSSPRAPCAIMPAAQAAKPANGADVIGTGPFQFVEFRPDSHVKLRRFDGYASNMNYPARDGFGGRKTAHFDTVTLRFMPEAGARTAALESGEVHVLEALPAPAAKRLRGGRVVQIHEMMPWSFQTLILNNGAPPTNNPKVRQAIQAALDFEEIMAISTDGLYRMTHGWQHPGTPYFAGDIAKEMYNLKDQSRARQLLQASGYRGEELVLLADSSFKNHKDTAEVAAEQLKQIGMNVRLNIVDWPTANSLRTRPEGWNAWALMLGIEPYEGPYGVVGYFTGASPVQIAPDPVLESAQAKLTTSLKPEDRLAAVRDFQKRMYDEAISIKVGDVGVFQASRANVANYKPYRIPRMWDCWFA